jgi:magnesium-transporting ATPase (P-type)
MIFIMNLLGRAINIILRPRHEWSVIKTEQSSYQQILLRYVAILTVPPIFAITYPVFSDLLKYSQESSIYRSAASYSLWVGIGWYALNLVNVVIIGAMFQSLFPVFASTPDKVRGLKISAYAATPLWIAVSFTIIQNGIFDWISLAALFYSCYLMYIGVVILVDVPKKKAALYTLVTVVASGAIIVALDSVLTQAGNYLVKQLWRNPGVVPQ